MFGKLHYQISVADAVIKSWAITMVKVLRLVGDSCRYETGQTSSTQDDDSLQRQVNSARHWREDWGVDADSTQGREFEASIAGRDDGGGGDQCLPFSSCS